MSRRGVAVSVASFAPVLGVCGVVAQADVPSTW